jgi:hypothetical protein
MSSACRYPEQNGRWTACCEDIPVDTTLDNFNSVEPLFAAQYIINAREHDWRARAEKILSFVEKNLIFTDHTNSTAPGVAGLSVLQFSSYPFPSLVYSFSSPFFSRCGPALAEYMDGNFCALQPSLINHLIRLGSIDMGGIQSTTHILWPS